MKQFPIIALALDSLEAQTSELADEMNAGADINYLSLNDFAMNLKLLRESFKVVVLARKTDSIHHASPL